MRLTKKIIINQAKKKSFRDALKRNKVREISLFGSVARNEARLRSDVDFLVEFDPKADLLDMVGLKQDLEDLLKHKVDVVTSSSLNKYLKTQVLREVVRL